MTIEVNKKEIIKSVKVIKVIFEDTEMEFECLDGLDSWYYINEMYDIIERRYNSLLKKGTTLFDVVLFVDTIYLCFDIDYDSRKDWIDYVSDLTLNSHEESYILIEDKKTLDYMIANLLKDNMK